MVRRILLIMLLFCAATYAAVAQTSIPPKPAKRYVITDYGAIGDGNTLNTKAIQSAIDRCASDGGGVIVVPKGYVSIRLDFS